MSSHENGSIMCTHIYCLWYIGVSWVCSEEEAGTDDGTEEVGEGGRESTERGERGGGGDSRSTLSRRW